MRSVTKVLLECYDVGATPGGSKVKCPHCGHKTLSVKANDEVAKCFHPSCSFVVTAHQRDPLADVIHELLSHIRSDCKAVLARQVKVSGKSPYHYLTAVRRVHPKVIKHSSIGSIPRDYDIDNYLAEASDRLHRIEYSSGDEKMLKEIEFDDFSKALAKLIWKIPYWLVFFYEDQYGRMCSVKFRKPYTKEILTKKPLSYSGVFIARGSSRDPDKLLVTEGEFNSLSYTSLLADSSSIPDEMSYSACSVGGVATADWPTIVAINRHPKVCFDNDASGAGQKLINAGENFCSFEAFTTPDKDTDLDEFISGFGGDGELAIPAVLELLRSTSLHEQSFESIARLIDDIRQKDMPGFLKNRSMAKAIISDLSTRGTFYNDGRQGYWLRHITRELILLNREEASYHLLMSKFGINGVEHQFKYVFDALNVHAMDRGQRTEISRFSMFNSKTLTLYLNCYDNRMYRITETSIDLINNGMDGVLFVGDSNGKPFKIGDAPTDWSPLDRYVLSLFNFHGGALSPGESKTLFIFWFLGMFFEELLHSKPVLVLLGPKGSGKTNSLRTIGQLLVGPYFDVTPLSSDEKDFDAAVTNAFLVVLDNVDNAPKWLDDKLATSATGGSVKRRELYTTNRLIEFKVKSFVAISTRTPRFRRDDVADRLLVLRLARIHKFTSENVLRGQLLENRDLILSEVVGHLQRVLKALKDEKDRKDVGSFRMADFGNFALRIAASIGMESETNRILKLMSREQSMFTLEDDALGDLVIDLATRCPGKEFDAARLCNRLDLIARERGIVFKYRDNPRGLAQRLRNIETDLSEFVNTKTREAGSRVRMYSFMPRHEGENA